MIRFDLFLIIIFSFLVLLIISSVARPNGHPPRDLKGHSPCGEKASGKRGEVGDASSKYKYNAITEMTNWTLLRGTLNKLIASSSEESVLKKTLPTRMRKVRMVGKVRKVRMALKTTSVNEPLPAFLYDPKVTFLVVGAILLVLLGCVLIYLVYSQRESESERFRPIWANRISTLSLSSRERNPNMPSRRVSIPRTRTSRQSSPARKVLERIENTKKTVTNKSEKKSWYVNFFHRKRKPIKGSQT